jgi:ketosteroid isomerase-like protein
MMEQSSSVQEAMRQFYARFSANDVAAFLPCMAQGTEVMVIGTGPTEWYEGGQGWADAYAEQIAAIPGIRLEGGDIRAWEVGDVGWAADQPTFVLPDGTAIKVRLTTVLCREGGEWRLAQAHASFGVPDEVMMELASQGQ